MFDMYTEDMLVYGKNLNRKVFLMHETDKLMHTIHAFYVINILLPPNHVNSKVSGFELKANSPFLKNP